MKKILLASTMLVSIAGFAAAEVSVSGDARMGVVSSEGNSTFDSRVRIKFTGSGTTDGGLSFGGSFRAADSSGANSGTKGTTFISGAFGKITMGDVDSGDNVAVGQLSSVGYESLGSGNSISYVADGGFLGFVDTASFDIAVADGAKVLYSYSAGALSVSASSAQLSNGPHDAQAYGLGVAYTAGALTLAVGYGSNEITGSIWSSGWKDATGSLTDVSASATYVLGDTTIKAIYQDKSASATANNNDYDLVSAVTMGASADHKIDAVTLTAYAITTDLSSDYEVFDFSLNRYGIGASYDLGGGASVKAGWAEVEAVIGDEGSYETVSTSAFDAGVNFSF